MPEYTATISARFSGCVSTGTVVALSAAASFVLGLAVAAAADERAGDGVATSSPPQRPGCAAVPAAVASSWTSSPCGSGTRMGAIVGPSSVVVKYNTKGSSRPAPGGPRDGELSCRIPPPTRVRATNRGSRLVRSAVIWAASARIASGASSSLISVADFERRLPRSGAGARSRGPAVPGCGARARPCASSRFSETDFSLRIFSIDAISATAYWKFGSVAMRVSCSRCSSGSSGGIRAFAAEVGRTDAVPGQRTVARAFADFVGADRGGQGEVGLHAAVLRAVAGDAVVHADRDRELAIARILAERIAIERVEVLHRALAVGLLADHEAAAVVLHRGRKDLRRRGAEAVDEDRERAVVGNALVLGLEHLDAAAGFAQLHDRALRHEQVHEADGLGEVAAAVFAQVEHDAVDAAVFLEFVDAACARRAWCCGSPRRRRRARCSPGRRTAR